MVHKQIKVDNTVCSRRFHIRFDDAQKPEKSSEIKCLHCGETVYSAKNHPPLSLARDEILIKSNDLSEIRTTSCQFKDNFPREETFL